MRIAETLHMPVKEVMQLDVLEIELWYAWFKLQQETMKGHGNATNKHRTRR